MRLAQIRDVLRTMADFHGRLAAYYARLAERAAEPRLKMLLDYRSGREARRQQSLADYAHQGARGAADAYVDCGHANEILGTCEQMLVDPEMTVAGVTSAAIGIDLCLLRFYTAIAATAEAAETRALFTELAKSQEAEIRRHARDAQDADEL